MKFSQICPIKRPTAANPINRNIGPHFNQIFFCKYIVIAILTARMTALMINSMMQNEAQSHIARCINSPRIMSSLFDDVDALIDADKRRKIETVDDITLNPYCKWAYDAKYIIETMLNRRNHVALPTVMPDMLHDMCKLLKRASRDLLGKELSIKILTTVGEIKKIKKLIKSHELIIFDRQSMTITTKLSRKPAYNKINPATYINEQLDVISRYNKKRMKSAGFIPRCIVFTQKIDTHAKELSQTEFAAVMNGDRDVYEFDYRYYINAPICDVNKIAHKHNEMWQSMRAGNNGNNSRTFNSFHNTIITGIAAPL